MQSALRVRMSKAGCKPALRFGCGSAALRPSYLCVESGLPKRRGTKDAERRSRNPRKAPLKRRGRKGSRRGTQTPNLCALCAILRVLCVKTGGLPLHRVPKMYSASVQVGIEQCRDEVAASTWSVGLFRPLRPTCWFLFICRGAERKAACARLRIHFARDSDGTKRNPKQIPMLRGTMFKTPRTHWGRAVLEFGHCSIRICFGFRISDFEFRICTRIVGLLLASLKRPRPNPRPAFLRLRIQPWHTK